MVKKNTFLDVVARPIVAGGISIYVASIASILILNIFVGAQPLIRNDVLWQSFIFPPAMFLLGWALAKLWKQPKAVLSGIIFASSAILLSALTWWAWSWLFGIFLWHWWNGLSSVFVQIISAAVIQLLITITLFGRRTNFDRIRSQLYVAGLVLAGVVAQLIIFLPNLAHVMSFYASSNPGGSVFFINVFLLIYEYPLLILVASFLNIFMLRKVDALAKRLALSALFAFYASQIASSLSFFVAMYHFRDPINLWITLGAWVATFGLDIWVMLYFRSHLPLRKG